MAKNLLIVESPAKAKTIEKFLGKDFKVKSSYGHIRDLEKGNKAVEVEKNFAPRYVISPEKTKVVKELKEAVKNVEEVWLATDEDREGEAISWHLCKVLGLDEKTTKRIVFHEITKPAIQKAVQTPRTLDLNLVDAQQARRILDRLVGFELSETLWKKIKGKLSAGRVQSVAVKLIVEREREIQQFTTQAFYKISAAFSVKNQHGESVQLLAELPTKLDAQGDARAFLEKCAHASFSISDINTKPYKKKPAAPFTTSTLQQEASRKLGFSVKRTMVTAQKLYEAGHITYMRTDSTNLSNIAISAIAQEVENKYGKQYVQTRQFKNKNASAQEAHEAIRPTYIEKDQAATDRDEQRLYELIWKRTIASQMAEALVEKTTADIAISTLPKDMLRAEGEVLKFDGFLKVYIASKEDDEEDEAKGMLPPLKVGQNLPLLEMQAKERYTRPPARYSEAGLVKQLEELGIGRPSTYAPTISKITEDTRGYVVKDSRDGELREYNVLTLAKGTITEKKESENTGAFKNRLVPTDMGMVVTDFLEQHFDTIMDVKFTANIEEQFDTIAEGNMKWQAMLHDFYQPFHGLVEKTIDTAERADGERILGKDPVSGKTVLVRLSRFGKPVVQMGAQEELAEGEKPKYANLKPHQSMSEVEMDDVLELFKLPKDLGQYEGAAVSVGAGRFGPYVKFGETFISLPRGEDPLDVDINRAIELIKEKQQADAPILQYEGHPVTKGKGRFGPFLKWKDIYINIPVRIKPDTITKEQATELIKAKVDKEANRYIHQWESEKISVENGRWGPFIRFGKKNVAFPKVDGNKVTAEEAAKMTLQDIKKIIKESE
jgi:DNA topoisomerase-1